MVVHFNQIVASLTSLSKDQLKQIELICSDLQGRMMGNLPADEALLFVVIRDLCGVPYLSTGEIFNSPALKKLWKRTAPPFIQYIDKTFIETKKSKVLRLAIMQTFVLLITGRLKSLSIPPSPRSVMQHLPRAPEYFDEAYPGYLESGLAYLIPEAMEQKVKWKL